MQRLENFKKSRETKGMETGLADFAIPQNGHQHTTFPQEKQIASNAGGKVITQKHEDKVSIKISIKNPTKTSNLSLRSEKENRG